MDSIYLWSYVLFMGLLTITSVVNKNMKRQPMKPMYLSSKLTITPNFYVHVYVRVRFIAPKPEIIIMRYKCSKLIGKSFERRKDANQAVRELLVKFKQFL